MKKNRSKEPNDFSMTDEAFSLSLGELLGKAPPQVSRETTTEEKESRGLPDPENVIAAFAQVTLHRQSAGRGGKTVTLVAIKPPQRPEALEVLAKALRKGLGCGSHVEEDRVVLQGDIPDRAQEWFLKKGARKVVRGN